MAGDVIGGNFDSMLAKLIVTGADREQALQRARRALAELTIEACPPSSRSTASCWTTPHSHRLRAAISRCTPRWIETEFNNTIPHVLRCSR